MSVDMTKWCELAKANINNRPTSDGRLGGKIVIVTGAAQGFGKGIAEELYSEGASVIIADMNLPLAEEVAKNLGERAAAVAVNVANNFLSFTENKNPTVVLSTASPYKFTQSVLKAIMGKSVSDAFKGAEKLMNETAMPIPEQISSLKNKERRFTKANISRFSKGGRQKLWLMMFF